jgi:hypothetical protein
MINIVNLIDHRLINIPVIRFKIYRAFHDYTTNSCIYPLGKAKEDGFIKSRVSCDSYAEEIFGIDRHGMCLSRRAATATLRVLSGRRGSCDDL